MLYNIISKHKGRILLQNNKIFLQKINELPEILSIFPKIHQ